MTNELQARGMRATPSCSLTGLAELLSPSPAFASPHRHLILISLSYWQHSLD